MQSEDLLKKIGWGIALSVIIVTTFIACNSNYNIGEVLFYEILPGFKMNEDISILFKYNENDAVLASNIQNGAPVNAGVIEDTNLVHKDDIEFQLETDSTNISEHFSPKNFDTGNIDALKTLDALRQNYYIVDKRTGMTADYFNAQKFASTDLKLNKSANEPKILVFHTHSHEMFADSNQNDLNEGIVGAGARLCNALETKYNIKTLHVKDRFDVVNGKIKIQGAYERMEPKIREILKQNPSIEMVIDMHRDGVADNVKLVQNINGKQTAQIMFFNGLCKLNQNGKLNNISGLSNPYIETNLALSFNLKRSADSLYPNLTRKIYLNAYRYSLHMKPKSTLIEVGAQTNTKQEIFNAVDFLADIINDVVG